MLERSVKYKSKFLLHLEHVVWNIPFSMLILILDFWHLPVCSYGEPDYANYSIRMIYSDLSVRKSTDD